MPIIPNAKLPAPDKPTPDMDKNYRFRGWRIDEVTDVGGASGDLDPRKHRDINGDTIIEEPRTVSQPEIFRRRLVRPSRFKLVNP